MRVGVCATCAKPVPSASDWELRQSGWIASGDTFLCGSCQEDGWRFPDGASLPYRAFSER
jgi:hypothetical protein